MASTSRWSTCPGRTSPPSSARRDGSREPRAVEIGQQILGSLAEAHDAGIVHRDVKPANVMLTRTRSGEDLVKVLDFGIAKLRDEKSPGHTTTSVGAILGTPSYLAPEQARGEPLDGRADLYAVGCVLHELVAGRPPFEAPTPVAVVSAHLHEPPPPLAERAPGVSRRFAAVVERALAKRPGDRFQTADAMRDALLGVGETTGDGRRPRRGSTSPRVTGELEIASRADFHDFERQVRALRRSRVLTPVAAVLVVALGGAAAWRWPELYDLLAARAPSVAARLPEQLRPAAHYDGNEREPNDVPGRANTLPLPPGPDGRPGGGVAVIRGTVGAKLSDTSGDVDIFRLEVPAGAEGKVLLAQWRAEHEGEGIRGLDVALALNRERTADDPGSSAPLVASVNRGGPGRPETLIAAVEPGTYYLSVREHHDPSLGPVEKPTDRYELSVQLTDPTPGEEVEPNDAPQRRGGGPGSYAEWRALASRNPLVEGSPVRGETAEDDADVYLVEPREPPPALVAAVPDPGLALVARLWSPDADDLRPERGAERVRLSIAAEGSPGGVLLVRVPAPPRGGGAAALVELRASRGAGRYAVVALGEGQLSGEAALASIRALAEAGRLAPALELAAGYADAVPRGALRDEVLLAAGRLAEEAARELAPEGAGAHDAAAMLLGAAIFQVAEGRVLYGGAFEAAVRGPGGAADEAALRLLRLTLPCAPEDVATGATAFLARRPAPAASLAAEARLLRARALEEAFWASEDPARLDAARAAWRAAAGAREGAAEARRRSAALRGKQPAREGARSVCR
jgi:eukaryotic-like serine/threonine-protein kinase